MTDSEKRRAIEIARLYDHLRRTLTREEAVITRGIGAVGPEVAYGVIELNSVDARIAKMDV